MNNLLIRLLEQILNNMKSGNSNINEEEELKLIDVIQEITSEQFSKLEAADYIGVCRATFDNYVNKGLIPKGRKQRGVNVLFWNKSDLDKYLNSKKC